MTLNVWTQNSGHLIDHDEGTELNQQLPCEIDYAVTYTVISGQLPPGLRIQDFYIVGTPYEVARETTFTFCIRASKNGEISDRTFSINIVGSDEPEFITPEGLLDVSPSHQLYVIDNTFINYQLVAIDADTITGQELSYYMEDRYGSLPPGLTLTKSGVIYGVLQSVTSVTPQDGTGQYDNGYYDIGSYDFANVQSQLGYDGYDYDRGLYAYIATLTPTSINRTYEFEVVVTDSQSSHPPSHRFKIAVINQDYFRADSDAPISSDIGLYTADVSYLQRPIWITPSYLGLYRANNYVTLVLDVYDTGLIYYTLESTTTAWQPLTAYKLNDLIYENANLTYICLVPHTSSASFTNLYWGVYGLPPGMMFDERTGEVYGRVPEQPAVTIIYRFTITATRHSDEDKYETASASRTFTLKLIGEIDSVLSWVTTSNLGSINAGYNSTLLVRALSVFQNSEVVHTLTSGTLPPGLTLMPDGEIIGKVSQFASCTSFSYDQLDILGNVIKEGKEIFTDNTTFDQTNTTLGLTSFDLIDNTTFDNYATTFDRNFTFTVTANDQAVYSENIKTFNVLVKTPNTIKYSNIRVKPFLTPPHRNLWNSFIKSSVFTGDEIYRPYDPSFGVQSDLSMLVFEGIKTTTLSTYKSHLNFTTKRFRTGNIRKAYGILPGTHTIVYEVVYLEIIDPIGLPTPKLNNIASWRAEFEKINPPKHNFLPLWMQSVQPDSRKELGYTAAVPICFCKVGQADSILLKIKYSGFDFKLIDYSVDRFIIDSVEGSNTDKYIIFNNNKEIL